MLQDYRRRIKINPFAPVLKDQSSKRWKSDLSITTNISLLSISDASQADQNSHNDDRTPDFSNKTSSVVLHPCEQQRVKRVGFTCYTFNKHLNGIPSTVSTLVDADFDPTVHDLFDESKSSKSSESEDYDPRAIRPPPFAQYIEQLRRPRAIGMPRQRPSSRIPVRTTRSEQLKLARQQSVAKLTEPPPSSHIPKQQLVTPSINPVPRPQTSSQPSLLRTDSTRSYRMALHSATPLHFSPLLLQQMQREMENNRGAFCSEPLTQTLLQEQFDAPLDQQYKMRRICHWLDQLIPTDYIEHNESASIESTLGTNCYDKPDDEYGLLSDEALPTGIERTYAEAHRVLPIFQSEVHRKTQQYNHMLTRLELDLYVM